MPIEPVGIAPGSGRLCGLINRCTLRGNGSSAALARPKPAA